MILFDRCLLNLGKILLSIAALALGASLTIAYASGTTANLTWTAPTQYTDGSAIAAGELDHYTITWAPATGQVGPSGSLTVAGNLTATTVPVACGQVSFTITVTTTASAKYANATSAPGGPVPYATGVTCVPKAVTGLGVS
jgi:hypothetical protein